MNSRPDRFSFDEVVRLMEVFSDDTGLRNWFRSLQDMTETNRMTHLQSMAAGMRTTRERPELIAAVESLISPDTFRDAIMTVKTIGTI
ncbi:MAG: hypothetical protein A2X66_08910 [Ignavibacteria bacterium GWA2_54_16]|nr:MAG: hypothetical protein A2X66_08910 [Ignavibacteria bacterium GWA2_54_16]